MSGQYIYSNKYGFTNGLTTEETTENGQIAHTNGTVVGREGVEPSTNGLRVHCSTNWANGPDKEWVKRYSEEIQMSSY